MTDTDPAVGGAPAPPTPAVELRGITKAYGAVVACDSVDLVLHHAEIHGVLGENGAGKSTLMKVLIGLVPADAGEIRLRGERARIFDPVDAARHGIGMVHQHFSLVPALRVWENVILGDVGSVSRAKAVESVRAVAERYGLDIDPDARVSDLSAGQRQRVEIVKCLRRDPHVIVLDEPTSVLTPAESVELFRVLRRVAQDEGRAVVLISHKLEEIRHATDRVTIMRQGCVVEQGVTSDFDATSLARAMVGRDVVLRESASALGALHVVAEKADAEAAVDAAGAPPVLRLSGVSATGADGRALLDRLSLEVRPGEIVGIAGVEGNGQAALGALLSSLLPISGGTVEVDGKPVRAGRHGAMAAAGVGVIPEDRHASGCVLDMTVAENLVLDHPGVFARGGLLDRGRLSAHARRLIEEFDISTPGPDVPMWQLSGGNQQRVVLARELSRSPKVLVASQPTRGLDVGAIEYMTGRLRAVAEAGVAVLLISTELEEVLDLADRVLVLYRGHITGEMARGEIDVERLGLLMGGAAA